MKQLTIVMTAVAISLAAMLLVSNLSNLVAIAQVPPPTGIQTPCPPPNTVQHWDKVFFTITSDGNEPKVIPPEFVNTKLDAKFLDDPARVANLEQKIRQVLVVQFNLTPAQANKLSLDVIDVLYQTVTCGAIGPKGSKGDKGDPGSVNIYYKVENFDATPTGSSGVANCNPGDLATGGGYFGEIGMDVSSDGPFIDNLGKVTGWGVSARAEDQTQVQVYVLCADITP